MPSINVDFLRSLKDDYKRFSTFVETGTYLGGTTFAMEPLFDQVITIEISELYHNRTKALYSGSKIKFVLGDSSTFIRELAPTLTEPTIFFLDGHWSAGNTGKGAKDCPLMEEVASIHDLVTPEAILIIDDYRLFGKGPNKKNEVCDWEGISKGGIVALIADRITQLYHLPSEHSPDDRLIIHIGAIRK